MKRTFVVGLLITAIALTMALAVGVQAAERERSDRGDPPRRDMPRPDAPPRRDMPRPDAPPRPVVLRFTNIPAESFMDTLKQLGRNEAVGKCLSQMPIALNEAANAVVVIVPPEAAEMLQRLAKELDQPNEFEMRRRAGEQDRKAPPMAGRMGQRGPMFGFRGRPGMDGQRGPMFGFRGRPGMDGQRGRGFGPPPWARPGDKPPFGPPPQVKPGEKGRDGKCPMADKCPMMGKGPAAGKCPMAEKCPMMGKGPAAGKCPMGEKCPMMGKGPMAGKCPMGEKCPMMGKGPAAGKCPMGEKCPGCDRCPMRGQMRPDGQRPMDGQCPRCGGKCPMDGKCPMMGKGPAAGKCPMGEKCPGCDRCPMRPDVRKDIEKADPERRGDGDRLRAMPERMERERAEREMRERAERDGRQRGPGGLGMLLAPETRERLRLSDDQVARLREMIEEFGSGAERMATRIREAMKDVPPDARAERLREMMGRMNEERVKQQAELRKRLMKILTPDQREKAERLLDSLHGRPDGERERPDRPAPPQPQRDRGPDREHRPAMGESPSAAALAI